MSKVTLIIKAGLALFSTILVSACGTQAHRVDCDGPLVPINVPAPSPGSPAAQPSDVQR